jgi:proton-translocating NADH-quinone oxidoreductase chain N
MDAIRFTWIMAIPLAWSPVVYLAGRLGTREHVEKWSSWLVRFLALAGVLAAWVPYVLALRSFLAGNELQFSIEKISLAADGLSLLLAGMVLTLGTLVILYSGPYMAGEIGEEKYYAMLLAMMGLMIGLGFARDLFNLWVWFEAMAISSYLLVAFYREQAASLEAGMKYLVQSATGSALVLMGIALVLAATGSVDMATVSTKLGESTHKSLLLAAGALFLIGYGVKVALVPLHTWLPDAHSQAPSGISAMLSGVVIEAGLVAMLKALGTLGLGVSWGPLLMVFGAINMLYGNLLALRQSQLKRMLAFSSLSHVGYMLFGLGITLFTGVAAGAQGAFFHLLTHTLMKGLAFLAVGAFLYVLYIQKGHHGPLIVNDLAGAATKYPLAALALSLALLALGGMPLLAGFMSKWQIFVAGFQSGNGWIIGLAVFMAFNSVLSLGYYAPVVNMLYRRTPSTLVQEGAKIPFAMLLPLILLALAVIAIGLWPGLVTWLSDAAGLRLVQMFGQ